MTATPVEVATVIARRLGLTGALGTVAETVDGVYTGRLVGEPLHGPAKADGGRGRWPQREGLDLSRCAAYSDSANDIPMLSLVGHPCAINPDAALREHARAHGWRVGDYRRGRKAASSACAPRPPRRSPARSPPRPSRRGDPADAPAHRRTVGVLLVTVGP